jgi:hypothetical protein
MRLYTNRKGNWAGTQADAKKMGGFFCVDVPTIKPELLNFLNLYNVKETIYQPIETPSAPTRQPSEPAKPREIKQNSWDEFNTVKKHLETCNREAVFTIMNLAIQRYYELDGVED